MLAVLGGLVRVRDRRRCAGSATLGRRRPAPDTVAELEAAREAKYRELRDAELDHRTGKLSDADYAELDREPAGRGDRDHAQHRPRYHRAP